MDTFWGAVCEAFLEFIHGGAWNLEQYRRMERNEKAAKAEMQRQMEAFRNTQTKGIA